MKPRITLVTLGVDDLDRALAFYRHGLGTSDGLRPWAGSGRPRPGGGFGARLMPDSSGTDGGGDGKSAR